MAISTNSPDKTLTPAPNPSPSDPPAAPNPPPPTTALPLNPNPNPNLTTSLPIPPQIQSFGSQPAAVHPPFRPATLPVPVPIPPAHQFSSIPNPSFQNHGIQAPVQVQPPGVMVQQPPGAGMMPPHYAQQPMRMYAPMPNGYQMAGPQGTMNPPVSY